MKVAVQVAFRTASIPLIFTMQSYELFLTFPNFLRTFFVKKEDFFEVFFGYFKDSIYLCSQENYTPNMKTPKQPTIEEKKAREQRIHERRMKHKRPKKRFQFWKNIEFWVIFGLFAFIAYTRYVYHNNTELLNEDYKITTGYIYKEGGIGYTWSFYYYFNVYSAEFQGVSSPIKGKKVGDTIQVRYYVPNPAINRWEGEMH